MNQVEFDKYAQEFEDHCVAILGNRSTQYQTEDNPLYNFEIGSSLAGATPAQVCWIYMTKHLGALRKKVVELDLGEGADMDDWLEKCTDVANYAKLLYIVASAEHNTYVARATQSEAAEVEVEAE